MVPIVYEDPAHDYLEKQLNGKLSTDEYYHFRDCICEDNHHITSGV